LKCHYRAKMQPSPYISQGLPHFFITFSPGNIGNGYTIDKHHQLSVIQSKATDGFIVMSKLKVPLFQSFVIEYKTTRLPMQELDFVAYLIDKDIHRSIIGFPVQFPHHQPAETVKTLPHICRGQV